MTQPGRAAAAALAWAALVVWAAPAAGQKVSRRALSIGSGSTRSVVGGSAASYDFVRYSFGLGSLPRAMPNSPANVLRSTLAGQPRFGIRRGGGGAGAAGAGLPAKARTGIRYAPEVRALVRPVVGGRALTTEADSAALSAAQDYLNALEPADTLEVGQEPLTSLVPPGDSPYARYLAAGESAMRSGRYREAADSFTLAKDVALEAPESLINLSHATLARSRGSYEGAAFYLAQALRHFPKLPLVPLRPRAFFAGNDYAERKVDLETHVVQRKDDASAHLLLAYLQWFQERPQTEDVRDNLLAALAAAKKRQDDATVEAVETFWRGAAVAAPETFGELYPEAAPATRSAG